MDVASLEQVRSDVMVPYFSKTYFPKWDTVVGIEGAVSSFDKNICFEFKCNSVFQLSFLINTERYDFANGQLTLFIQR